MSFLTTLAGQLMYLNVLSQVDLILRLYSNNHTPSKNDTLSNYTEVAHNDYSPISLNKTAWVFAKNSLTNNWVASQPEQSWTFGSSVVLAGYYITQGVNVVHAEQFIGPPQTIPQGTVRITPAVGIK